MKNTHKLLSILFIALSVTACGGGGGSSSATTPTTPVTQTPTTPTTTIDDEFAMWLNDISDNVILPGYENLQSQAQAMTDASAVFCSMNAPTTSDLSTLRDSWLVLNLSWQHVQWIKVGPILEESRLFRMQFWPDSNNAVGRGVDSLLLEPTITAEFVATQNVGAQGIPALEYLLYAQSAESLLSADNKNKRCEAVEAIAQNMQNVATDVNTAWQSTGGNYVDQVKNGTGDFTSPKDVVEELVTNWLEQIERIKDEKMLKPLDDNAPGLPSIAEFTLSEASIASIKVNLATLSDIFTANNGHGFDNILADFSAQSVLAEDMQIKIDLAINTIELLDGNYADILNNTSDRETITATIQAVREIRDLLTADFVQVLDINIGFNSNDGD